MASEGIKTTEGTEKTTEYSRTTKMKLKGKYLVNIKA